MKSTYGHFFLLQNRKNKFNLFTFHCLLICWFGNFGGLYIIKRLSWRQENDVFYKEGQTYNKQVIVIKRIIILGLTYYCLRLILSVLLNIFQSVSLYYYNKYKYIRACIGEFQLYILVVYITISPYSETEQVGQYCIINFWLSQWCSQGFTCCGGWGSWGLNPGTDGKGGQHLVNLSGLKCFRLLLRILSPIKS